MEIICSKDQCTGCQACRLACPKQCISMQEDERGNIYPVVDQSICIDCKKCQKVCPILTPTSFSEGPIKVYAGWTKEKKARNRSTSGAISYALSKFYLSNGGAFCGAVWLKNGAKHRVATNISDIMQFQGSKYSHSDVGDCYGQIKDLLISGKKVLFTGTPCQCAALRNFLGKEYEGLYVVDLVCHGVPSRLVLREHLKTVERKFGKKIVEMRFREKAPTQITTNTKYVFEDGNSVEHSVLEDFFYRSFADNYVLREGCYHCHFSRLQRVSDITIADFWGYSPRRFKFRDYEKGVSIILINNQRGESLFSQVKESLVYEERDIKENYNQNLYEPQHKPADIEEYWKDYLGGEDREMMRKKYFPPRIPYKKSFSTTRREYLTFFIPCWFYAFIRGIKHRIIKIVSHKKL